MKKSKIKLLLNTVLCALLLTACGKAQPEAPAVEASVEQEAAVHIHEAESWDRNMTEHW